MAERWSDRCRVTPLTWLPGTGALTHDVYFGPTQAIALLTNQTTATFIPGTLEPGATYSWRIDEHTASGIVTGDVWSFTTQPIHYYEWRFIDGNLAPSVGQGVLAYADAATAARPGSALPMMKPSADERAADGPSPRLCRRQQRLSRFV